MSAVETVDLPMVYWRGQRSVDRDSRLGLGGWFWPRNHRVDREVANGRQLCSAGPPAGSVRAAWLFTLRLRSMAHETESACADAMLHSPLTLMIDTWRDANPCYQPYSSRIQKCSDEIEIEVPRGELRLLILGLPWKEIVWR